MGTSLLVLLLILLHVLLLLLVLLLALLMFECDTVSVDVALGLYSAAQDTGGGRMCCVHWLRMQPTHALLMLHTGCYTPDSHPTTCTPPPTPHPHTYQTQMRWPRYKNIHYKRKWCTAPPHGRQQWCYMLTW